MEIEDVYFNINERVLKRIVLFEKNCFLPFLIKIHIEDSIKSFAWYHDMNGNKFMVKKIIQEDLEINLDAEYINNIYEVLTNNFKGFIIKKEHTIKIKQNGTLPVRNVFGR